MEQKQNYGARTAQKIEFDCPPEINNAIRFLHKEIDYYITKRQISEAKRNLYLFEIKMEVFKIATEETIRSTQIDLYKIPDREKGE
jgi:hypothetical protein